MRDNELSQKIVRNSFFSEVKVIISICFNLLIIPYIIKKIGIAGFGTWAIFIAIMNLVGIFDFGLTSNITRIIAKYKNKNNKEINILLNTTFTFLLSISIVLLILVNIVRLKIFSIFFHDSIITYDVFLVYLNIFIILGIFNLFQIAFNNILVGCQNFKSVALINTITNTVNSILLFIFLYLGYGFFGITLATGLTLIILMTCELLIIYRKLPSLQFNLKYIHFHKLLLFLKFGLQVYLTSLANNLIFQGNKLIVTFYFGISYAGYFDIALRIVNQIRIIYSGILETIMPLAAEIKTGKITLKIKKLYLEMIRNYTIILFPLFLLVILYSNIFIKIWLQKEMPDLIITLELFSIMQIINLLTGPAFLLQAGLGKPKYGAQSAVLGILVNYILFPIFSRQYGYLGSLFSLVITYSVSSIYFLYFFYKKEEIKVLPIIKISLKIFFISIFSISLFFKILSPLVNNIYLLLASGFISILFYFFILLSFRIIKKEEINLYIKSFK